MKHLTIIAALALAACGDVPEVPDNSMFEAPGYVAASIAERVPHVQSVTVTQRTEDGWLCGWATDRAGTVRLFVYDGATLTMEPAVPDSPTVDDGLRLASFAKLAEGCNV